MDEEMLLEEQETYVPEEEQYVPPPSVRINGEDIPYEQLQEGWMRQADYTQKTQSLAEERKAMEEQLKQAEGLVQLSNMLQYGTPEERQFVLETLQSHYGPQQDETFYNEDQDPQVSALQREIASLKQQMNELHTGFRTTTAAEQAAQSLAQQGIEGATPQAIMSAMKATGIQDPEAAFIKANLSNILQGARAPDPQAPNAPLPGAGKQISSHGKSLWEIEQALKQGYQVTS